MSVSEWFGAHWWKLLTVYIVIGLLTFGNAWNDSLNCEPLPKGWSSADWDKHWACTHPLSVLKGAFWPIVFVAEGAIWVTR